MTQQRIKKLAFLVALAGALALGGCAKKVAKATPPPPPAPAAPTATVAANKPSVVQQKKENNVTSSPTDEELFGRNVKDVFFDYDRYAIRSGEVQDVQHDETFLSQHPSIKVLIEGHCDDRGSEEYNIALGASRAESLKQALTQGGISAERVRTLSLGKEKPFCTQDNEQCWQQNTVDHFAFDR